MDPSRILIFDADKDDCMPPASRDGLWEALGRPERYSLNCKHKMSFFAMTPPGSFWLREKAYDFLADRLKIGEPERREFHPDATLGAAKG